MIKQSFDAAWKNVLLADSYVWSDANSFGRPDSYRTRGGEASHRAWAEAALQQTSDLRLVAADKIAELVGTDKQGTVVLNPESWQRSDFFDFELEPDEALVDPATRKSNSVRLDKVVEPLSGSPLLGLGCAGHGLQVLRHNKREGSGGRSSWRLILPVPQWKTNTTNCNSIPRPEQSLT